MERNQGHIDEGTLHAWLDGALPPEEAARVEAHVASCAACSAAAAEARGLVAAASRILTALDDVPGGVAPGGRGAGSRLAASTERRRRLWTGWPLRAAAAIVFVVAGSYAVYQQSSTSAGILATPSTHNAPAPAAALPSRDSVAAPPAAPVARPQPPKKQSAAATREAPAYAAPAPAAHVPTPAPAAALQAAPAAAAQAADQTRVVQRATDSLTTPSQEVVTGTARKEAPTTATGVAGGVAKGAVNGLFLSRAPRHYTSGCYAIDAPGLPARIELGLHPRVPSPDSAAFGIAYWFPDRDDSVRISIVDTAGTKQQITAAVGDSTLRGQVTRSDSSAAKPFVATRIGARCP